MRVMVLVKATTESEAGIMPSPELLEAMGKYNEELGNAGILLAGEGLHPSVKGKRIAFDGPHRTVIDGPFAVTRELVAGFWLWQVKDMAEAVEWVKRCPTPCPARARSRSARYSRPPTSAKPSRRRLPSCTIESVKRRTPAEPPAGAAPLLARRRLGPRTQSDSAPDVTLLRPCPALCRVSTVDAVKPKDLGLPIGHAASRLALRATARGAAAALTRPARWAVCSACGRPGVPTATPPCQGSRSLATALAVIRILRITAVRATFPGRRLSVTRRS